MSDQIVIKAETLELFVASRTVCNDLGAALKFGDFGDTTTGFLYLGELHIENNTTPEGKYHLVLERDEYFSNDLPDLERKLYDWAIMNGYAD